MKLIRSACLAAVALAGVAGTAQARDVYWSVGIDAAPGVTLGVSNTAPVVVAPPVYVAPQPVYVAPPPRYYYQPVYVQPAPVYYGTTYYYGPVKHKKHKRKKHKRWDDD